MPSRAACVAILAFWMIAATGLFRRDILPDLMISPAPDLRSIARAEEINVTTRWDLQVADDASLKNLHTVGRAETSSRRLDDGSTELLSKVRFDSGGLLRGTPFASQHDEKLAIENTCLIDPSGNLRSFLATCRVDQDDEVLVSLDGKVEGREIKVRVKSPLPLPFLNRVQSFAYEPRGMVQNAVGPIDRMPGLQIGQRWETKVVSPLFGRVEVVTVEVAGKHAIHWGNSVVTTLEVVHHISPTLTARTWVRRDDGLVLRQEVPFPFVKLILERIPGPGDGGPPEAKAP